METISTNAHTVLVDRILCDHVVGRGARITAIADGAAEIDRHIAQLQDQRALLRPLTRRKILERARTLGTALASHDDPTTEEIAENLAAGIMLSELPVTMLAARTSDREARRDGGGLGRPKYRVQRPVFGQCLRGQPGGGGVSCVADGAHDVPAAMALIRDRPTEMVRLSDRGRSAVGLRADQVRRTCMKARPWCVESGVRGNG
ncbi:MAG: hypothetical protein EXR09_04050 [Acetobacteraceae bacterium]|nr:hypothetical protein [Acetobacteraceae bacterium]